MSYTLSNSGFLAPLLGDGEIAAFFEVDADLKAMLDFEMALAATQADFGLLPVTSVEAIKAAANAFAGNAATIGPAMARDGVVAPALVDMLRQLLPEPARQHFHLGSTSQDAVDTSMMLRAKSAFNILSARLDEISGILDHLTVRFGGRELMARTRMQQALPISVADRLQTWRSLVQGAMATVERLDFSLQFGGPVGTVSFPGVDMDAFRTKLAGRLGLSTHGVWHAVRLPVTALGEACCAVSGALGKIGLDMTLMAQNEISEVRLSGTGGSSAMAHKQNPVKAEALVALARFNASLLSGLHQGLLHENERSGAAWTLEWMALPQLVLSAGASTRLAKELLNTVEELGA